MRNVVSANVSALFPRAISRTAGRSALFLACAAALVGTSEAASLYWDADADVGNNTPPMTTQGGTGTWNGVDSTWYWYNTGALAYQNTVGTTSDIYNFGATAGTVTLSGTRQGTVAFRSSGYTLTGGTLNTANIDLSSGPNATINSDLAGSTLTKKGLGVLILGGTESRSGATTVYGGITLNYDSSSGGSNTSKLPNTALTLQGLGGTLTLNGGSHTEQVLSMAAGVAATNAGNGGAWTVTRTGGSTATLQLGALTRATSGTLNFTSAGLATTSTANTNGILSAAMTINGTDWAASNSGSVGALATYDVDTYASGKNTDVQAASASPAAFTTNTLRFNANQDTTLTLTGTNTLFATYGNGRGSGILVTPNVGAHNVLITGGVLRNGINGGDIVVHQYNTQGSLTIETQLTNLIGATSFTKTGPGTLVLGGSVGNTFDVSQAILDGTVVLKKTAGNALSGSSTGSTVIYGGSVRLEDRGEQINDTAVVYMGGRPDRTSTLDLNSYTETVGFLSAMNGNAEIKSTVAGGKMIWGNNATTAQVTNVYGTGNVISANVDLNTADGSNQHRILNVIDHVDSLSVSGVISDSRASYSVNPVSLQKNGLGTLTLSGANTYAGATQINGGTLAIGAAERILDTSALILAGGRLSTSGFSETMGSLSITGSSSIDFGSGASTLRFSSLASFTSDRTLTLLGWTSGSDHFFIGTTAGLTEAQLAAIKFVNGASITDAIQLGTGEIVMVPEPQVLGLLAGGVMSLLASRRKR